MATKSFAIANYTPPNPMPAVIGQKESIMYLRWRGFGQGYNEAVKTLSKHCEVVSTSFKRSQLYTSASVIAYADKLQAEKEAREAKAMKSINAAAHKAKDAYQPIDLEQQFKGVRNLLSTIINEVVNASEVQVARLEALQKSVTGLYAPDARLEAIENKLDMLIEMWESKPPTPDNT